MEWIEVSARTLDDARELALDRLGVVADELEYEVIDEPKGGLFGIGRTEARIRARVRPISREKPTDRRRRRSSERRPSSGGRKPRGDAATRSGGSDASRPAAVATTPEGADRPSGTQRSTSASSRRRRRGRGGAGAAPVAAAPNRFRDFGREALEAEERRSTGGKGERGDRHRRR